MSQEYTSSSSVNSFPFWQQSHWQQAHSLVCHSQAFGMTRFLHSDSPQNCHLFETPVFYQTVHWRKAYLFKKLLENRIKQKSPVILSPRSNDCWHLHLFAQYTHRIKIRLWRGLPAGVSTGCHQAIGAQVSALSAETWFQHMLERRFTVWVWSMPPCLVSGQDAQCFSIFYKQPKRRIWFLSFVL